MRFLTRIMVFMLCATLLLVTQSTNAQQDSDAAQEIIRMINGWRIEQGIWPLRSNPVLERMALDQANYILSLPSIPAGGAIHNGASGESPQARALLPRYNWTPYGGAQYTAIGEIAYVGISAQSAYDYWNSSTVHHNTALNPAYREIGVAALPHRFGHIYIVVVGSRPDVLPAMVDLQNQTLYLTNERYTGARSPWIRNASQVRLFDGEGRSLDAIWRPWAMTIRLPANAGSELLVAYSDGNAGMVLAEVSLLSADVVALPTPTNTATRTLAASPTPASNATAPSGTPTPLPFPTILAPPNAGTGRSILLVYDQRSFTLINGATTPLNVEEVVFVNQALTFPVSRWATQWLSGSLQALASSDCLQVWSWQQQNELNKPSECRQRRSVITIAPNQLFWLEGEFQVRWRDSVIGTCIAAERRCTVTLPSA